ncbi:MAG: hypothetical protein R3C39_15820 [Dehalococcoidia bacterium]
MAGSRIASQRREAEAAERRARLLLYITIGVLAAVVVIVGIGLYITQYLPPRAHVATIAGQDYNADDVAKRGSYYMIFEGGALSRSVVGIADVTIDLLAEQAVVLQEAPAEVGEVTDADIEAALRERLGFDEGDPAFTDSLADLIRTSGFDRDGYFQLVRAQVLGDRLSEQFLEGLPTAATQWHLERVRLTSRANAEALRDRVLAGESMDDVAQELASDPFANLDIDWWPLDLLAGDVRDAVGALGEGDLSEPVQSGLFFDVYRAVEVESDRELTEDQRNNLASLELTDWIDEHRDNVEVTRDLSTSESDWIAERVLNDVQEAIGG